MDTNFNHMANNPIKCCLRNETLLNTLNPKAPLKFLVGDTHSCAEEIHPADEEALLLGPTHTLPYACLHLSGPALCLL